MDESLKKLLETNGVDYVSIPSSHVPSNSGEIIAIENYFPKEDEDLNLSIALSIKQNGWDPKCWLSVKINNVGDSNKPLYHPSYQEFEYNGIKYYPYSIKISSYPLSDILDLCGGLYKYVKEENEQ